MGSSSQAMAKKEKRESADAAYLLPLVSYTPIPNILEALTVGQREMFFTTLRQLTHCHKVEEAMRNAALLKQPLKLAGASLAGASPVLAQQAQQAQQTSMINANSASWSSPSSQKVVRLGSASSAQSASAPFASSAAVSSVAASASLPAPAQHAASALCGEVNTYAQKDEETASGVVTEFESRIKKENYKSDDLMAVLLLVIEDDMAGEISSYGGGAGAASGASHFGGKARRATAQVTPVLVPAQLRIQAMESAQTRLASIREMLRYYFLRHPNDFKGALAAALGITADREEDQIYMQERLASELATIGSFALAQKVLAEIKRRKRMDTEKCLLELGYLYDKKRKRLVLGKRTCGTKVEAKGIVSALLSKIKGRQGK